MKRVMEKISQNLGLATILLGSAIFFVDLSYPVGVAVGVLYTGLIFLSIWSEDRGFPLIVGVGCTVLTLFGFVLTPTADSLWVAVINRGLTLFAIWVTASLCFLSIDVEEERQTFSRQCERIPPMSTETDFAGEQFISTKTAV